MLALDRSFHLRCGHHLSNNKKTLCLCCHSNIPNDLVMDADIIFRALKTKTKIKMSSLLNKHSSPNLGRNVILFASFPGLPAPERKDKNKNQDKNVITLEQTHITKSWKKCDFVCLIPSPPRSGMERCIRGESLVYFLSLVPRPSIT